MWVDLELRHDRLFGTVHGTGLVVSARSLTTLREKVIDALRIHHAGLFVIPRVYWRHRGREIEFERGTTDSQVYTLMEADHARDDLPSSQAQ